MHGISFISTIDKNENALRLFFRRCFFAFVLLSQEGREEDGPQVRRRRAKVKNTSHAQAREFERATLRRIHANNYKARYKVPNSRQHAQAACEFERATLRRIQANNCKVSRQTKAKNTMLKPVHLNELL